MGITKQLLMEQAEQEGLLEFFKALSESGSIDPDGDLDRQLKEAIAQEDPSIVMDEPPEELQPYLECSRCANPFPRRSSPRRWTTAATAATATT